MDSNHLTNGIVDNSNLFNNSDPTLLTTNEDTFQIVNFTSTASGFDISFNRQLETATIELNYFDLEDSDLTVADSSGAFVRGSIVLNEDSTGFSFVKTGDTLAPGNYTVTLKSGDGVVSNDGTELDGNGDGTVGDDYVIEFAVDNPERIINLSDIVLLPEETIENEKLSVSINDGADVTDLVLKLEYDPKLFNIANIDLAEELEQWDITTSFPAFGKAAINLTGDTALSSGEQELIEITAAISDITYGTSQVIKITDTSVNNDALTSVGDTAIHHIALPGEVSADINYNSTDSYLISKFSTGLNDNFTAYSAIDPFLFADLNQDGVISAFDAYLATKLEISDTTAPTVSLTNQINTEDTVIELAFEELVNEQAANLDNYTLTNSEGETIEISSLTRFNSKRIRLETASPLVAGNYQLNFTEAITDLVGNEIEENQLIDIVVSSESIEISPTNGEEMVTLTRETTVHFGKQVDPETVTSESFYAIANGEKIPGRIDVSSTEEFANLFYDEPLPQSTEVRVVVDGDSIIGRDGVALDGDNDGTPGGIVTSDFRTLPLSRIEGTDVFGYVYDSYNRGEDGSNIPLEGVKITLDSLPDVFAITDENGYFILEDVPAPDFYVYIDGSEVVNVPEGRQYASLGKAFHSVPGQAIQLEMDGEAFDIYLPTMAEDDVVGLSDSENTEVGFGAASLDFLEREFPDVDPNLWQQTQVTFAPNSAIDEQGNAATQGMIVPVNPERLPAPLPPNVDPGLVISIQAGSDEGFNRETEGGATNFDIPAPVSFPNTEGLAPGEKSLLWSFDHDAGDWTIIGTGTVSEDGTSIVSDEGVGVLAPGWHFTNPGVLSEGKPPKEEPEELDWDDIQQILNDNYASKQGTAGAALANQIRCIADESCRNEDTWGGGFVKDVFQDIATTTRDTDITDFLPNLLGGGLVGGFLGGYGDLILEKLPNWSLEIFDTDIIKLGDISAVLGGFGRHFPYELLPGFVRHCNQLSDEAHNSFFEDAVVPCFDTVVGAEEISDWAGEVAKKIVPPSATVLREVVQALCPLADFLGFTADSTSVNTLQSASLTTLNTFPELPASLSKDELYLEEIESVGTLDIGTVDNQFFIPVGDSVQISVTKENSDGTIVDLTSSEETQYFAVIGDETVEIDSQGLMTILGTLSPLTSFTPSLYVLVRNGDDVGIGQFAVTDVDTDGDLIVDSYETKFGLNPNIKNELNSDLDEDGLSDLSEILFGTDPIEVDTDGDNIDDRTEIIFETGAQYSSADNLITQENQHFFALNNLDSNFVQRGKTESDGSLQNIVLASDTEYELSFFNPDTLKVGSVKFVTPEISTGFTLPQVILSESSSSDLDTDGLNDDAEFVIGTLPDNIDTDNDGISDSAEIEQGLDPLGGQGFPTGIVSSLPLRGEANAVTVDGSTSNSQEQTAYVATGSYGLAVVDASQFNEPIVLGQLDLAGDATDVAVDSSSGIAAVATNAEGLQLVDVSDPMMPSLIQTIKVSANQVGFDVTQVEVFDGIAYISAGSSIRSIDLVTGESIQNLSLPGSGTVTGMAREGTQLYTFTSGSDTFSVIDISNQGNARVLGQTNISVASTDVGVFAGNGIAYIAGGGLQTIDISDANNPTLISDADSFFTARNVTLNGSGLALVSSEDRGVGIYSVSDPQNTANFITSFDTPGFTNDIAIASGIAFVADDSAGLQVINYLAFDSNGEAPTVTLNSLLEDVDPDTDGIQVIEGSSVPLQVDVTDDVQVRNVELLVDGEVVSNDVSFPYDLNAIALGNDPDADTITVQARATDTGGNTALSEVLTLDLVPDTIAPTIETIIPGDGQTALENLRRVTLRFSEALNSEDIVAEHFQLLDSEDNLIPLQDIQLREGDSAVQLTYSALPEGEYQLVVNAAQISDRAGNLLGDDNITNSFTLEPSQFIDISQTGDIVPNLVGDDLSSLIDLPFELEFYGQTYTQAGISSNGLISLGGTNTAYTNESLESGGSGLNGLPTIAPFWDDLETRSDEDDVATVFTEVIGSSDDRKFIIQWHQLEAYPFGSETGDVTFQAILSEGTNEIQFNYLDVDFEGNTDENQGKGGSATVGIWNSPEEFQQYSFNEPRLSNGLSLILREDGISES